MRLSRRSLLAASAGILLPHRPARDKAPRPGCQANGWNLDPAHFDMLLTAIREMKQLGFQGFETNLRFVEPQLDRVSEAKAQLDRIGLEFIAAHTNLPDYEKLGPEKAADEISKSAEQARKFGAHAIVVSHKGLSPTGEFPRRRWNEKHVR